MLGFYIVVFIGIIIILYYKQIEKQNIVLEELSAFDLLDKDITYLKGYGFRRDKNITVRTIYIKYNEGVQKEVVFKNGISCEVIYYRRSEKQFELAKIRQHNLAARLHLFPTKQNLNLYSNEKYLMKFSDSAITVYKETPIND